MAVIHDVLELARWAPSGDNTQPWRFEIRSDTRARIHGFDTREQCVYDLDGCASRLAHGALLENIALAATRFGMRAVDAIESEEPSGRIVYDVALHPAQADEPEDPLVACIEPRSVQRRAMSTTPLSVAQRAALEAAVVGFDVHWMSALPDRWRMAALNARNAHIRLTIPEAFAVHASVIEWHAQTSEDRMPDASLGAGPLLLTTMRFAMQSFERLDRLNRLAGGTLLPRLALDLVPGIACAAHFALIAREEPRDTRDHVHAGRAMQRFWLTATRIGLQMQPSYTPLVFARYARENVVFTRSTRAQRTAREVARRLDDILGVENARKAVFLGRLGARRPGPHARSTRLPLDRLIADAGRSDAPAG